MEWSNIIINDFNGETVVLCECKCRQEITETIVEHIKRDRYTIAFTCLCLECEMCWIETLELNERGRDIQIIYRPDVEE